MIANMKPTDLVKAETALKSANLKYVVNNNILEVDCPEEGDLIKLLDIYNATEEIHFPV